MTTPLDVFDQQNELVAAVPEHAVDFSQSVNESLGNLLDYGIACGVPVGVVDRLELVEVEHADRQQFFMAARTGHGGLYVILQADAIA